MKHSILIVGIAIPMIVTAQGQTYTWTKGNPLGQNWVDAPESWSTAGN